MKTSLKDIKDYGALLLFLLGVFLFDVFNFFTSKIALDELFSIAEPVRVFSNFISVGTVLALAACLIDFGGLVRVFTPQKRFMDEPIEIWLITGAWVLAAAYNAFLTWFVVQKAVEVADLPGVLVGYELPVSISVAVFVFIVRFLLVSSLAYIGDKG
jgi:hypothetical protein